MFTLERYQSFRSTPYNAEAEFRPMAPAKVPSNISSLNKKKDALVDDISLHNGDYTQFISKLWGTELDSKMQLRISKFKQEWNDLAKSLENGESWKDLKNKFKNSDKDLKRLENFRQAAIKLIEECVNDKLLHTYGLPPVKSWGGVGTPGVNSDVDLSLSEFYEENGVQKQSALTEKDLMLAKSLFETLWTKIFNGLSGEQGDTEVYVRHNGTFASYDNMQTEEGKSTFITLEHLAAALTAYKNYTHGGIHPDDARWEQYTGHSSKDLATAKDPLAGIYLNAKNLIDAQADKCNAHILKLFAQKHPDAVPSLSTIEKMNPNDRHALIENLKKDPKVKHELELNAYYYFQPYLMGFSKKLSDIQDQIDQKSRLLTNQVVPQREEPSKLDRLRNEFVLYSILRVTCFPEGYFTEGAFKDVVKNANGQEHLRKTESMDQLFFERGAKLSSEKLERLHGFTQSHLVDYLGSSLENYALWMYKAYNPSSRTADLTTDQRHLVDSSKYGERFVRGLIKMIHHAKQANPNMSAEQNRKMENLLSRLSQTKKTIDELLLTKRETTIALSNLPKILEKELTAEQSAMKSIQGRVQKFTKELNDKEITMVFNAIRENKIKIDPVKESEYIKFLLTEITTIISEEIGHEVDFTEDFHAIEIRNILNNSVYLNLTEISNALPITSKLKYAWNPDSLRHEYFKHELMKFVKEHFPVVDVNSTIEKVILPKIDKLKEGTKYGETIGFDQYALFMSKMFREHVWAVDENLNPLNTKLQATFEVLFNTEVSTPEKTGHIKKEQKELNKSLSLCKIESEKDFIDSMHNLNKEVMSWIYESKVITPDSTNQLIENLVDRWSLT